MDNRSYWQARATWLRLRLALARLVVLVLPPVLAVCAVAASGVLYGRLQPGRIAFSNVLELWAFALALAASATALWSWRSVPQLPEALARLDEWGGLHNRLTSAHAGVGIWPAPKPFALPLRWNWLRTFGPLLAALLLVPLALLMPVKPALPTATVPKEEPLAWAQVQEWLEQLRQTDAVAPEKVEETAQKLDALRDQPAENWFSQASLEAGDSLRQRTEEALRELQQNLQAAGDSAAELAQPGLTKEQMEQASMALQKAAQALQNGALPPGKELAAALKKAQLGGVKSMTAQQWAELQERLAQGQKVTAECLNPKLARGQLAEEGKVAPGSGGPGGGGKTAPLSLQKNPTQLRTKELEAMSNEDLSRALPADLAGLTTGEHEVDKGAAAPAAGGTVQGTGEGGSVVWREALVPAERAVLQKVFK